MKYRSIVFVIAGMLSACGGSDADQPQESVVLPPPANVAPVANAGEDITINEQTSVTLSGTGTDNDGSIVSYLWSQVGGVNVTLTGADSAQATFIAPDVNSDETLTFSLKVTDNSGATHTDDISVQVLHVNLLPTADAGEDMNIDEGATITINGRGSDQDGEIISYLWQQVSGQQAQLHTPNASSLKLTLPELSSDEQLEFQLTVTDNSNATHTDKVLINVKELEWLPQNSHFSDVNGDGVLDLLRFYTSDSTSSKISWAKGSTGHNFSDEQELIRLTSSTIRLFRVTDIDLDGKVDLLVESDTNQDTTELSWYRNLGNDTFDHQPTIVSYATSRKSELYTPFNYPMQSYILGNFDGKYGNDLIITSDTEVAWYQYQQGAGFGQAKSLTTDWQTLEIEGVKQDHLPTSFTELADYNGDGYLDLTYNATSEEVNYVFDSRLAIAFNQNGEKLLPPQIVASATTNHLSSIYDAHYFQPSKDVNGDGITDIVIKYSYYDGLNSTYSSSSLDWFNSANQNRASSREIASFSDSRFGRAYSLDWNSDGHLDYIIDNLLILNEGDGAFAAQQQLELNVSSSFEDIDIDLDGNHDLIYNYSYSKQITWHKKLLIGVAEAQLLFEYKGDLGGAYDLNNDGYMDFVSETENALYWYKNNGDLTFTEQQITFAE